MQDKMYLIFFEGGQEEAEGFVDIAIHLGVSNRCLLFAAETEERERNTEEEVFEPAEGDGRAERGRQEAAGRGDQAQRRDTRHGERHRRLEEGDLRARRHHSGQGACAICLNLSVYILMSFVSTSQEIGRV